MTTQQRAVVSFYGGVLTMKMKTTYRHRLFLW
jgi:hypothetical protein